MPIIKQIQGTGVPPSSAQNIAGSVLSNQTALGTNQATAYVLGAAITEFSVAASGTGCVPQSDASPGDSYFICNNATGQTIIFYPPGTDTINNAATSFSLVNNKSAFFVKIDAGNWASVLSA